MPSGSRVAAAFGVGVDRGEVGPEHGHVTIVTDRDGIIAAIFRGQTDRCRVILRETPYRALLVGLIGYGVLGSIGYAFYSMAFIRRLLETEIVPGMLGGRS